MMYLAEKAGKLYPQDWNKRSEVNQWLFFMNAGAQLQPFCTACDVDFCCLLCEGWDRIYAHESCLVHCAISEFCVVLLVNSDS